MNIGKYIFAQVIDFIPRYQFDKLVKKYKGDWHAKDLTCILCWIFVEAFLPTSISQMENGMTATNWMRLYLSHFAFYMMDKAYVDLLALYRFHKADAYWISRPKDNMRYEVINHRHGFTPNTGICGDFTIKLTTHKSKKLYPEPIRMVTYHDSETGNDVEFITNNFEISALEVANLYRHRWDIEVFFKWIKQNIVVKTLWGYSENAVRTHLWVAIIAYLIIAKIKADYKSPYSITEVATLIRISALERVDLRDLITKPKDSIIQNQNVKELTLLDEF